jgi:hypothetical protein
MTSGLLDPTSPVSQRYTQRMTKLAIILNSQLPHPPNHIAPIFQLLNLVLVVAFLGKAKVKLQPIIWPARRQYSKGCSPMSSSLLSKPEAGLPIFPPPHLLSQTVGSDEHILNVRQPCRLRKRINTKARNSLKED